MVDIQKYFRELKQNLSSGRVDFAEAGQFASFSVLIHVKVQEILLLHLAMCTLLHCS
jgi:hypothetical protein